MINLIKNKNIKNVNKYQKERSYKKNSENLEKFHLNINVIPRFNYQTDDMFLFI